MNTQTNQSKPQNAYSILSQTQCLRISDGEIKPIFDGCSNSSQTLVLIWSQLGDFDNLEYAWWLQREKEKLQTKGINIRAVGSFVSIRGFPKNPCLWIPKPKFTPH